MNRREEMKDLKVILVSKEADYFNEFSSALDDCTSLKISCITSGTEALAAAGESGVDVVAAAETVAEGSGLDLIKQLVKKNPFINTALVSPLSHEDFHEVTEGFGVFMQLSPQPGKGDADTFCELLAKIYGINN